MEVRNVTGTSNTATQTQTKSDKNSILGKDDFLKLLIVQMQNQNPLEPMNDQEFMSQMAQFSSLEQLQNLTLQTETNQALSLVGAEITASKNGEFITGIVEKVMFYEGKPLLIIGNQEFTMSEIVQVALPSNFNDVEEGE